MASSVLSAADRSRLKEMAARMRLAAVEMVYRSRSAHLGSALSMMDLLAVLYGWYLHLDPSDPHAPDRDRFILSKGHGGSGLYAALAEKGILARELLATYGTDGSTLAVHPSAMLLEGVELSTGSLGHGLPVGTGMAKAAQLDKARWRTVVLLSDGECDEGATWEAALAAAHWRLDGLIGIVDYNKIQSFGRVSEVMELEPFAAKWRSFGWGTVEIDGHDHEAIAAALASAPLEPGRPTMLIAHTVKGKGAAWMEDTVESHYLSPTDDHWRRAQQDLS